MADENTSRLRREIRELIAATTDDSGSAQLNRVELTLQILIVANVLVVMLETVEGVQPRFSAALLTFEWFSVAIFTIEYLLRLWCCTVDPRYSRPVIGRLRFALRPMSIIDLLAILPAYLPLIGVDLRFIRVLRLMRLARALKLGRYSDAIAVLARVLRSRRDELAVMLMVLAILLVLSSGLIYYAEHDAQPEAFSSIPAALWWSVITLTTIGYGDLYPVTVVGKVIGGFIAIAGIGIVALPTAIIASAFAEELRQRKLATLTSQSTAAHCPHCGRALSATTTT
jgi:voltage-gated potassium channel